MLLKDLPAMTKKKDLKPLYEIPIATEFLYRDRIYRTILHPPNIPLKHMKRQCLDLVTFEVVMIGHHEPVCKIFQKKLKYLKK